MNELPDWAIPGKAVEPEWRKRREAKRADRYVIIILRELLPALSALKVDKATRLFWAICLHRKLTKATSRGGWVDVPQHDLVSFGLHDSNYYKTVAKLERLGLVEVQRRPGKRPLLRLLEAGGAVTDLGGTGSRPEPHQHQPPAAGRPRRAQPGQQSGSE
jgi:hypothetical protein